MAKIDLDGLRTLLAERSVKPTDWWSLGNGETGALLADVRELASDANPGTRRQTWDALDQVVDDGNRDDFFALLVCGLDTERFRRLLTDTDPAVRRRTRWMDARGYANEPFVRLTLELLGDERFDYAWPDCVEVLRRPAQVDILVGALADAPDDGLAERLWVTLGLPAETRVPEFLPEQSSATDVDCLWDCDPVDDPVPAHRCRHLPIALALLGSSLEDVREDAASALCVFGPGVTDALRSVPRSARREALTLLAELGWQYLPPDDVTVLKRLIRVKQRTELPEPLDFGRLAGSWYALPTTDQAAVLAAFDLRDPVPATLRMGFAPWQPQGAWQQLPWYCGYAISDTYEQVFVTPALDGWTLVFADGTVLAPDGTVPREEVRFAAAHRRCAELSRRFGTAHWYLHAGGGGCWDQSGWCVAEHGAVVRYCYHGHDVEGGTQTGPGDDLRAWLDEHDPGTGTPPVRPEPEPGESAAEKFEAWLDDLFADHEADEEPLPMHDEETGEPSEFGALDVAWRLSVSPEALGPHTTVQGTGVLAVPAGRPNTRRYGALPI